MGSLLLYLLCYPFGLGASYIVFLASILGLMRKAGTIEFNAQYLQRVMFLEPFMVLTYILSIASCHKNFFICAPILISAFQVLGRDVKKLMEEKPNFPILNICVLKPYIYKASASSQQSKMTQIRVLIEVYSGLFITFSFFFKGGNSFFAILCFLQITKFRYSLNPHLKISYSKMNNDI